MMITTMAAPRAVANSGAATPPFTPEMNRNPPTSEQQAEEESPRRQPGPIEKLLGDRVVPGLLRDEQPAADVQEESQPAEHHQPDERDADQERIDVEEVADPARDTTDDAVIGSSAQEARGGGCSVVIGVDHRSRSDG